MKKILLSMLAAALLTGIPLAQSSAQSQTNSSASQSASVSADKSDAQAAASNQVAAGSTIQATLAKPVDARKNKAGDQVVAKTTEDVKSNGQVVIPKGSKIVGHVTEVKARDRGESESTIGIAFDRAMLKGGQEVPLSATIQAIARSEENASATTMGGEPTVAGPSAGGMPSGRAGGASGGVVGGAAGRVGAATGTVQDTTTTVGSAAGGTVNSATSAGAMSRIPATSQGVIGLKGLSLNGEAANSTQGSVIRSNSQNVHLDSGTQLVLRVNGK
jgi:hypothetical protein